MMEGSEEWESSPSGRKLSYRGGKMSACRPRRAGAKALVCLRSKSVSLLGQKILKDNPVYTKGVRHRKPVQAKQCLAFHLNPQSNPREK